MCVNVHFKANQLSLRTGAPTSSMSIPVAATVLVVVVVVVLVVVVVVVVIVVVVAVVGAVLSQRLRELF